MNVSAACKGAVLAFNELTEYIRFEYAELCFVVIGRGRCFLPVLVRSVAVSELGLREYQPALRLREYTRVLLCAGIDALHKGSVKAVLVVRRIHYHCAVRCVELALYAVHSLLCLFGRSIAGNNGP